MKGFGRISGALGAAMAGAAAALFLDPHEGARNRGRAAGLARRRSASVTAMVTGSMDRTPARSARRKTRVAEAVRAQLAEEHAGADAVAVTVHGGTVTLRGEVRRLDDIEALERSARSVDGVADVNNLLRLALPIKG